MIKIVMNWNEKFDFLNIGAWRYTPNAKLATDRPFTKVAEIEVDTSDYLYGAQEMKRFLKIGGRLKRTGRGCRWCEYTIEEDEK